MLAEAAIVLKGGAIATDVEDGGGERNAVGRFQAYASAVVKRDGQMKKRGGASACVESCGCLYCRVWSSQALLAS